MSSRATRVLPTIDARRCVRSRCNVASCDRCIEACPENALDAGRPPRVGSDACTGCMVCVGVCPADAIAPTAGALSKSVVGRDSDVLTLGCGARSGSRHDITVACIGAPSEVVLLTLLLSPGPALRIDATRCDGCEAAAGARVVTQRLRRSRHRAGRAALRSVEIVVRREDMPLPGRTHDRRGFFRALLAGGAGAVHDAAFGVDDSVPDARSPAGSEQRRLAATITALRGVHGVATEFLHSPEIAGHCSVCRCCAAVCPTGAIKRVKHEGRKRLEVDAAVCTGCNACVEFCPDDAITIQIGLPAEPQAAGAHP